MIYKVKRIDEDLDFGCEERADDQPVMAVVTLVDSLGAEKIIKMEDEMLYQRDINEGNVVSFDSDQRLTREVDSCI